VTGLAEEVIADPVGLVVRLVGNVEKHLPAERVRDIVLTVVRARAGRRSLAQALHDDPSLRGPDSHRRPTASRNC